MSPRRFLVAPDTFKGTIAAATVARAIAEGLREGGARASECPVADGGEGTIEVLSRALPLQLRQSQCSDPLGRPIAATWAWLGEAEAIVEMASASGLALLDPAERDAEGASSAGTGDLLIAARDAGARRAILAVGGTATTDGGRGALARIEAAGGLGQTGSSSSVMCAFPSSAPQRCSGRRRARRRQRSCGSQRCSTSWRRCFHTIRGASP